MRRYTRLTVALLGSALALATGSLSAAPSATMLANTCAGCHGPEGRSAGPAIPSLAGYSSGYFVETMEKFKSGERPATIMGRIAKGYTEEEIEIMAEYFAEQPVYKAKQTVDAAAVKKGEKIYEKGCAKCHDEGGSLPDDDAGILAGQWLPYLHYSMVDFKSGAHEMPKKMKKQVNKLSDAELDAVLQYFASQQ
jgi:sulfide dehydrogenase cytochrome subunit